MPTGIYYHQSIPEEVKKILEKIINAVSVMLGECQCRCHFLGYWSCGQCPHQVDIEKS